MKLTIAIILIVGLIQLLAQCLEAVTGFGSTVLAVPFMDMGLRQVFDDPKDALTAAKVVGGTHTWLLVIYVAVVSWKQIVWKEFGFIALHVLLGLPIGIFLFHVMDITFLKGFLALFMIGVGINGIRVTRRDRYQMESSTAPVKKNFMMRFILFLGGIIHGAFASGGPFVVFYASQALKDKTLFRVSICLLWLCLNTILLMEWTIAGVWTQNDGYILKLLVATLPFLLVGIIIGNYLHHRVSEYVFRLIVFALLLGTGFIVMHDVLLRI